MILNSEENSMLTRREILIQLKRVGVDRFSLLKHDCREYEDYLAFHYDYEVKRSALNLVINKQMKKGESQFLK